MRVLVDALSVNNLSGEHVLLGHLRQMVDALGASCQFTLLTHRDNARLVERVSADVEHLCAPVSGHWLSRSLWLRRNGADICRSRAIDVVFSPSGMLSQGCRRPQVVLAQNPWPLLPDMARGAGRLKAGLQRGAFGRAQRQARIMVFNSDYMRRLYADAFGLGRGRSVVAYQGIDESLFSLEAPVPEMQLRRSLVLSVSVMARHKAVEVLVEAFSRAAAGVPDAELVLAGAWPDATYRREIETRIGELGLAGRARALGHVEPDALHELYRSARVFCLLSRCESFGIPAVEAQAFGTPTVVAEGTAAPEVTAGRTVPQDDPAAAAQALLELLTDDVGWKIASDAARSNAQRFHWPLCSAPLIRELEQLRTELA